MSHECPECGSLCFCSGDIDDCMFNFPKDQDRCTHYTQRECCGYDGDDDDDEPLEDMEACEQPTTMPCSAPSANADSTSA